MKNNKIKKAIDKVDEGKAASGENNNTKISTKEGKPVVLPENWGKVDGVDFNMPFDFISKELDIQAVKICEIWEVKEMESKATIIMRNGTFESCEIGGNILLDSGDFASLEIDDWLFLGKVAREIERLAGER